MSALKNRSLGGCLHDQDTITYSPYTIAQVLAQSCQRIEAVDARLLLQHVMQVNHAYLITHANDQLSSQHMEGFSELISQRQHGTPVAYLIGERDFYDLTFKVSPAVLIPRPETELLVEKILKHIPASLSCRILDLGTGSGAIGITIAKHRPQAQVTAVDISTDAIDVARWNAQNLAVDNIRIMQGSWFDPFDAAVKFDWIVANPPYVAENDPHLKQGDLRFEPDLALSAKRNGMACIEHIITTAPAYLVNGGQLLFEHGYDQSNTCQQLLEAHGFQDICSYKDLTGIERACHSSYYTVHSGESD